MNMFEISYDVQMASPERNQVALQSLVSMLVRRIGSQTLNRYVASTLVFLSERNYFEVVTLLNEWSTRVGAYFIVVQVFPNEDGRRFYYTMKPNPDLQSEINELVRRAKLCLI